MKDFLQSLAFCIIVAVLVWAYCKATPDQCSAECDWAREQLEKIGGVSHGKSPNGEAEADAYAVGREAVLQGGSSRISVNKPSARCWPMTRGESRDSDARRCGTGRGREATTICR